MTSSNKKRPRVLVVDDDETFRNGLKYVLIQGGYDPVLTVNGSVAQQLLLKGGIDLVLSDINMPDGNGIQLLRFVRAHCPVPLILMTGLKSLIETREAFAAGAMNFLAKPFEKQELYDALANCLSPVTEVGPVAAVAAPERAYRKLSISDFVSGKEMKYDIYVQLSNEKYVKIAHGGSNLPMEQIQAYRKKGIEYLYMTKEDFEDYLKFNVKLGKALQGASQIPRDRRLKFLQQTSKVILEAAATGQVNKEILEQGTGIVETTVAILAQSDAYFGLMDLMESGRGDRLYAHSLAVSLYSSLMAISLGWNSPSTLFYVAAGALFHDIGKKEIPESLLLKPRQLQTLEERRLYETHPVRSAQILASVPDTPDEILWIVQQHHENESGSGYPFRKRKGKIYPLAKLVAVADEFCDAIQKEKELDHKSVLKVLEGLVKLSKDVLDPGMIAALMSVFKFEIPEEIRTSVTVSIKGRESA